MDAILPQLKEAPHWRGAHEVGNGPNTKAPMGAEGRHEMRREHGKAGRSFMTVLAVAAALVALAGTARADVVYHTGVVATASTAQRPATLLTDYSGFNFATMTVTATNPNNTMWNTDNGVTKDATWVMFDLGEVTDIGDMIVFNWNFTGDTSQNRRFVTADVWWAASTPTVTNPTVATPGNWTRLLNEQAFDAASYTTNYNTPTEVALDLPAARYVLMNDIVNAGVTDWGNGYGLSEVLFTTIPEPGTLGLLGATAIAMLLRRKIRG